MPTHSSITAGAAPRPPRKHELRYCSLSSSDMFTDLSARPVQLLAYLDPWHNFAMHTTGHRDLLTERSDQIEKCNLYALTMPSSMQHHSTWDAHKEEKVPRQHACCNGKTAGRRPAIPARWLHSSLSIPHVCSTVNSTAGLMLRPTPLHGLGGPRSGRLANHMKPANLLDVRSLMQMLRPPHHQPVAG